MAFGRARQTTKPGRAAAFRGQTQGEALMCGIVGCWAPGRRRPCCWTRCSGWNTAATTAPASRPWRNGHIERRRAPGKLTTWPQCVAGAHAGTTGVGHTRWATHGAPTETNAHPHGTARVSVVHNGIIENHAALREELEAAGQVFETETDTETVAQLLDLHLQRGLPRWRRPSHLRPAGRRLRAGHGVRRAARADGRRAARRTAGGGVRRGRDVPRLRQPGPGAADPAHRLPARRRLGGAVPRRRDASSTGRAAGAARGAAHRPYRRGDRQGRLPPLHGEGAARAPERHRPGAAAHDRPGDPHRRHARAAVRPGDAAARHRHGLRQRLLRRAGRRGIGWRPRRACRRTPTLRASCATASRRCRRAAWRCWSASRARRRTRWRRCAPCAAPGSTC